ncbi:phosphatidylserine decarboxylase [Nematocida sp. LUAm3]|nr:phosphatidylserine decarboxylase [Nematocida sp. LUAm3]KAI5174636.1 phosphatidylserine decarboxylase [Nematocida sp. LUAm2]KAI5177958.1 phosphatidylserine decarboxylase [Nematocida sp. LUAm1]
MDKSYILHIPDKSLAESIEEPQKKRREFRKTKRTLTVLSTLFVAISIINIIEDGFIKKDGFQLEHSIIRTFPLKTYSRLQGVLCSIKYPWPLNILVVGMAKQALGISLKDAERTSVSKYGSVSDLFARKLAEKSRKIEEGFTSPVDGTIIYAGKARENTEKIKGIRYKEEDLLHIENLEKEMKNPNNIMYQIVIYLAPYDYHRFHAPTNMWIKTIKHIPMQLLSVGKIPMKFICGLLSKNERVVFSGETEWGYFSLVAVGSTGVGSISTPFASIKTNKFFQNANYDQTVEVSHFLQKGDEVGHFNLGSTVVLVFEAPPTFHLKVSKGPVVMGQTIGEEL